METPTQLYPYLTKSKVTWRDDKNVNYFQWMTLKKFEQKGRYQITNMHTDITRGTCLPLCIKMNKCVVSSFKVLSMSKLTVFFLVII
jgi:hypothetical protein